MRSWATALPPCRASSLGEYGRAMRILVGPATGRRAASASRSLGSVKGPEMSEISVVVVSYNSRADLERSLPAVAGAEREVIVVDNASTDESRELVRSRFPGVELLELHENVGYGAA